MKFKKILAKTLVSQILLISIINMQIIITEVLQFKVRNLQLEEQIKEENFHQVEVQMLLQQIKLTINNKFKFKMELQGVQLITSNNLL